MPGGVRGRKCMQFIEQKEFISTNLQHFHYLRSLIFKNSELHYNLHVIMEATQLIKFNAAVTCGINTKFSNFTSQAKFEKII